MIEVIAKKIDNTHFYYECPLCWSKYKKNGTPYSRAKRLIHHHGSDNDLSNRIETRSHHGDYLHCNDIQNFKILITDETVRC